MMPEEARLLVVVLCAFGIVFCCYGMFAVAIGKKRRALSASEQENPSEDDAPVLPDE
jgi:hypothetical protein